MKYLVFLLLFLQSAFGFSQKLLSLADAEQKMQKNNLLLLAEQFNISASEAAVIQAKIWEQPYISGDINALNPQNHKTFDVGKKGQKVLAIQQLIYLGGKKKNEVAFAKSNLNIAKLQFEQLLRSLKYKLTQNFYTLHFDTQKVLVLNHKISVLDTLLNDYRKQAEKGNIALKEVVRLQSFVMNLKNERNSVENTVLETQQTLFLLIGETDPIETKVNEKELLNKFTNLTTSKDSLFLHALKSNLDYKIALKLSENKEVYLKWQKSLNVPDITVGAAYDQRGGAFQNQVNLTIGIPLPLWHKNRGNIKIAEAQLKQSNLNKDYKKLELKTTVNRLWALREQRQKQFKEMSNSVSKNLELVYAGVLNNFKKQNISTLEFTDFMESYSQTSIQMIEVKEAFILSNIDLNYIANKEIF